LTSHWVILEVWDQKIQPMLRGDQVHKSPQNSFLADTYPPEFHPERPGGKNRVKKKESNFRARTHERETEEGKKPVHMSPVNDTVLITTEKKVEPQRIGGYPKKW